MTISIPIGEDQAAELAQSFRRAARMAQRSPMAMATFCDPGYSWRPHLDLISRELSQLGQPGRERLLLRTPPQVGKTQAAAVWTPFWWLTQNPHHKVVIGSYSNGLAVNRGKQIRKLVTKHGWRYGLELEWGSGTVNDWSLVTGGGVKSAGVQSGLTGNPADVVVIDDPHKGRQEAESSVKRQAVWDWYSGDVLTRMAPGAPMVLILTPWHEDDLSARVLKQDGRLEDGGEWRVVDLPAFAGEHDPMGRAPGEPLTHPKIDSGDVDRLVAFWEKRRSETSARDWVSLYMLDPKPVTQSLVTEQMIRDRTHNPIPAKPLRAAVAVDPSGGGRDNAGVVGGYFADDRRLYVTEDRSLHGPSEKWGEAAAQLAAELDADLIVFENNYGGDMADMIIRTSWRTLRDRERIRAAEEGRAPNTMFERHPPKVESAHARKNKQLRAEPIAQQINDDRVRFGPAMPELKSQWTGWRPTDQESPGNLDACVYLGYALLPLDNEPGSIEVPPSTPIPGTTPPVRQSGITRPPTGMGMMPGAGLPGSGPNVVPALGDLQNRRGR